MYLFRKGFILLFALLFPVIVFLFLKCFGKNEYELLVYKSSCTNIIDELRIIIKNGEINENETNGRSNTPEKTRASGND